MKNVLAILIVVIAVTLAGCGNGADTDDLENIGTESDNSAIAMESLSGVWDWPNRSGNAIHVYADGTWQHELGDANVRGKVKLTQAGGYFVTELAAEEGIGPGFAFEGSLNPETFEYSWIPHPNPGENSLSGTFSVGYDRFIIQSHWNDSEFVMERRGN